jgi:hypothetical protein
MKTYPNILDPALDSKSAPSGSRFNNQRTRRIPNSPDELPVRPSAYGKRGASRWLYRQHILPNWRRLDDMNSEERPQWMTEELVQRAILHFQAKSSVPFGEDEAVQVLLPLSQLLEATGLLKLEIDDEDEEVHRMGESKQS